MIKAIKENYKTKAWQSREAVKFITSEKVRKVKY